MPETELDRLQRQNNGLYHALKGLLRQAQYHLDQSATDQGLENCRILAEVRAILHNVEKGA